MKSFTAGQNEDGVRLSRFVESVTHQFPRSMMYNARSQIPACSRET